MREIAAHLPFDVANLLVDAANALDLGGQLAAVLVAHLDAQTTLPPVGGELDILLA